MQKEYAIFYSDNEGGKGMSLACFGFELKNINKQADKPSNPTGKRALNWHKRFFDALSDSPVNFAVVNKIRVNDKFENKPNGTVRIALLFYVSAKNRESLEMETKLLFDELSILFISPKNNQTNPYHFSPVTSQSQLRDLSDLPSDTRHFDYLRRPVYFKKAPVSLGFKSGNQPTESVARFFPQFFIPDLHALGNVIHRFSNASGFLELSVFLKPIKIREKELLSYKKFSEGNMLHDEHFTDAEKRTYNSQLEVLMDDNTSHFLFHVQLSAPTRQNLGHSFHNVIADSFFGNIQNVVIKPGSAEWHLDLLNCGSSKKKIMPFLYSREIVQHSFRLPLPDGDEISWFMNQADIFNYFPEEMPSEGVLLGEKKVSDKKKMIRIKEHDLARHMYVLGQTGVGKTTLLKTMILDQINKGEGVCVVDPHGDLVSGIYNNIPFERIRDVILFDPTHNQDIKINILEFNPAFPEQRTFIFNELIRLIDELYDLRNTGGPMFEQVFKNALFMIMEIGGTLHDFHTFFYDKVYRDDLLLYSKLKTSVTFFRNLLTLKGDVSFESFSNYITSKINRFVQDDFIAPIIAEKRSTINFRQVLDSKKILLIRLPKGRLGSDGVKFIGTLLFNRIIMATFTRENIAKEKRTPFYMYIDEFQNFTTQDMESALSEARKYGLRLILANQTLSQLNNATVRIILGNAGSQIFFRPGPFDIDILSPYFRFDIKEQELLNLSNFKALARLLHNDMPMKPFIFDTINHQT